jgi:hypothetical protein
MTAGGTMRPSLRITHISWGHIEVEGLGSGKDFKLYPGGGREWDWRETNTEHIPGVQPADVQELLEKGSKVVGLTRGMQLRLQTCPETLQLLKEKGIGVHVEETRRAAELYNKLAENELVGGHLLSACQRRCYRTLHTDHGNGRSALHEGIEHNLAIVNGNKASVEA